MMSARAGFTETWRLRAGFAAALSRMYGAEVPAYTTLVDVATAVNRDHPGDGRLGTPIVYEDFLPDSAAGIFRSNLAEAAAATDLDDADDVSDYSFDWLAAAIGHHVHDPYDLYEKAAS